MGLSLYKLFQPNTQYRVVSEERVLEMKRFYYLSDEFDSKGNISRDRKSLIKLWTYAERLPDGRYAVPERLVDLYLEPSSYTVEDMSRGLSVSEISAFQAALGEQLTGAQVFDRVMRPHLDAVDV